jgi:predicted nucleic acid-binding protein
VKFWDSSAIVPLLVRQTESAPIRVIASDDPEMLVWWATPVECASALARLEREQRLGERGAHAAFDRLRQFAAGWHEVEATDAVREAATRFLRVHALRAGVALQLAAAFVVAGGQPSSLEIVTLDDRLASAAKREGFTLTIEPSL